MNAVDVEEAKAEKRAENYGVCKEKSDQRIFTP
jgi:hypothetical protein